MQILETQSGLFNVLVISFHSMYKSYSWSSTNKRVKYKTLMCYVGQQLKCCIASHARQKIIYVHLNN